MGKSYADMLIILEKQNSRRRKIKMIIFFPLQIIPKKIRAYIARHWKESNKVTITSEICGIIGLAFSIATFFYAQEISNQQNEMERITRDKEINNILDKSIPQKISLFKESMQNNSNHKAIISSIITIEEDFYDLVLLSDFALLDTEITENISKNDSTIIKIVISFMKNIKNFTDKYQKIQDLVYETYSSIANSDLLSQTQFKDLLTIHAFVNMKAGSDKFKIMQKELEDKLQKIITNLNKNNNAKTAIKVANELNDFLKKENSLYIMMDHIRTNIKFLDYTISQELVKQTNKLP